MTFGNIEDEDYRPPADNANIGSDGYDYGPLRTYEVTWASGHVERIQGHSVSIPSGMSMFGAGRNYWMVHGQFGKSWRCMLTAREPLVDLIRDVTDGETLGEVTLCPPIPAPPPT